MVLSKEEGLKILRSYRPDLKTEEDWREMDIIMVMQWLLPIEWQNAERRINESK